MKIAYMIYCVKYKTSVSSKPPYTLPIVINICNKGNLQMRFETIKYK